MYAGYGAMMISRQMVTILSPALLKDESLGFTVKDTGDILAFGTIGAMVGKLIWGPTADRIGGRSTFLLGIFLTALLIAAFGLSYNVLAFTLFSAASYATKSSGWPGMTKLVGNWIPPSSYGRIWAILSTSSRASVFLGTLLFGYLLSHFHWRTVAFISTGTALLIYVLCQLFLRERPEMTAPGGAAMTANTTSDLEKTTTANARTGASAPHPLDGTNLWQGLSAFAKSPRVYWVVLMLMMLTCAMAFLDFLPAYLLEVYNLEDSQAAMASAVMPLGSLLGLLLSIAFYDRFSKRQLRGILTLMLICATGCIFILQSLAGYDLGDTMRFGLALSLIVVFGVSTAPAYYIPMSIFSIEYGGPHSATLVSLIDMFAFAASASFGFLAGRLAAGAGGWDSFMNLLLAIGMAAAVSTWFFMRGEARQSASRTESTG